MGVTTLLTSYPGGRVVTYVEARVQVASWLRARFAGTPAARATADMLAPRRWARPGARQEEEPR
jgi:hypothetical protein